MLYTFECSVVGSNHEICQDSSRSARVPNGVISVVADGVGSAANSEKGSAAAVNVVIDKFAGEYNESFTAVSALKLLFKSYQDAMKSIYDMAQMEKNDVQSYDTTLTAVVMTDNWAVYGHCGDGAIFRLIPGGLMTKLTTEQKGEYAGEVYPLRAGEIYWNFGICSKETKEFIIVTDGMLDYLNIVNSDPKERFHINSLKKYEKKKHDKQLCDSYIRQILGEKRVKAVTSDDKTYAVIVNDAYRIESPKSGENPILFCGEAEILLNFKDERYCQQPYDILGGKNTCFTYSDKDSKLKGALCSREGGQEIHLFYPVRETEIVLDADRGIEHSIHLSYYLINKALEIIEGDNCIEKIKENVQDRLTEEEMGKKLETDIVDEQYKIAELNNYEDVSVKVYQFRDFFHIFVLIPDGDMGQERLDVAFQLKSYMYNMSCCLVKGMLYLKKHIEEIPKPLKDYEIHLSLDVEK